jgi:glycosyltransferase involved in cell wall biosynthesis
VNVLITLPHRFDRTPDGAVWTRTAFARPFYSQYLEVFEGVRVAARVRDVESPFPDGRRADGDGVWFHAIPYYVGALQFIARAAEVRSAARRAVEPTEAVILRVESQIATFIEAALRRSGRPYGLEVVGDPYESFAPGCVRHPLRPLLQMYGYVVLKAQCARAPATAYVTENALQSRYPPASGAFSSSYSDAEMPADAYVSQPRKVSGSPRTINLISVGSLEQLYKGSDVLIDAVRACVQGGLDLTVTLIGDGKYRLELERRAGELAERARFLGLLPAGAAVRAHLDQADIFVLPSRSEGLPRALLEAMARALPCIGSAVGGIPELLAPEDLVPPGDSTALAQKIREVLQTPGRMVAMSARNLRKSREYCHEILQDRRNRFYRHVKEQTEVWLKDRPYASEPQNHHPVIA